MTLRRVFAGSVSVLALASLAAPALAQDAMETVVITGIRASMQRAMDIKRDATTIVDAVSAEDIGKFPDKNVADALQRVPGVNTVSAASGEGGFDENDRVSIRGTNPSLTQTLVDGHSIANGDWFILDQYQTVGRSVSYTLLPSEIVSTAKVYKSQQADLVEGGVAGLIDIQTRKPLDFKENLTLEATAEAVYSTLREGTAPQFNALFGWKNDAGTFGIMVQAFHEERQLRRDGQEVLGYNTVGGCNGWTDATKTVCNHGDVTGIVHPDLIGVMYPTLIGSSYFLQQRVRQGGSVSVQIKPSNDFEFEVSGFYSHLGATNYNQNYMYYGSQAIHDSAPSSYKVVNNTLVQASFPTYTPVKGWGGGGDHYAGYGNWSGACANGLPANSAGACSVDYIVADFISRPGSGAETYYLNGDATWTPSANLTLTLKGGYTHGVGRTPSQPAWEGEAHGATSYDMTNGINGTATVTNAATDMSQASALWNDWSWNDVFNAVDREYYVQGDAEQTLNVGPLTSVKAGFRYANHKRTVLGWVSGVSYGAGTLGYSGTDIATGNYPSNYASDFASAGMLRNVPLGDPAKIAQVLYTAPNWRGYFLTPAETMNPANQRFYWQGSFGVDEEDIAGYLMANVGGEHWKGNFGVRIVETDNTVHQYVSDANGIPNAFGNYRVNVVNHTFWDVLPSMNLSFNINDENVLRFSAAETMARPDYSALGGAVNLTDLIHVGTGGNADLRPIKAAVYNLSYEWYYGPESMLSVGVFYNDLSSYVTFATHDGTYLDSTATGTHSSNPIYATYAVTTPINTSGHVEGIELQVQQPIWGGFGVSANYTYANGVDNAGGPLVGDSKNTANITGYYENTWLSARLSYSYRSKMLVGLDRSSAENQDAVGTLNASVQVTLTDYLALTFDGLNLTNQTLKYFANNVTQPRALYSNGSQLYAGIRLKY